MKGIKDAFSQLYLKAELDMYDLLHPRYWLITESLSW
jgi:hypothetical protein